MLLPKQLIPRIEQNIKAKHAEVISKATRAMIEHIEIPAKINLLKNVDSGNLWSHTTTTVVENGDETEIVTGAPFSYGLYLDQGTGIYQLDGKGRKTPWFWEIRTRKWSRILNKKPGSLQWTRGQKPTRWLSQPWAEHKNKVLDDILR